MVMLISSGERFNFYFLSFTYFNSINNYLKSSAIPILIKAGWICQPLQQQISAGKIILLPFTAQITTQIKNQLHLIPIIKLNLDAVKITIVL